VIVHIVTYERSTLVNSEKYDRSGERAAASDRLETDILPSEPTSDTGEEMVAMQPTRPMRLSSERL
jgi:hypothetical protein